MKDEVSVRSDDEDFDTEVNEIVNNVSSLVIEPKKEVVIVKEEPKKVEVVVKEEPKKVEVVVKEEPKKVEVVVKEEPKKEETPPESETEAEADEEESDLVDFEYKGITYYRDSENQVYELNEKGELNEDPIGVWNEQKQKVQKYPKQ